MKTKKLLLLLPLVVSLAACNTGGESTSGEGSTSIPTSTSVEPTSSPTSTPTSTSSSSTPVKDSYLITFKDENGGVLDSKKWEEGTIPSYSYVKEDTAEWDYTVEGWSLTQGGKVITIPAVSAEATYWAIVSKAKQKYDISFYDEKNGLIKTDNLEYGAQPSCDYKGPQDTPQYDYDFEGWTNAKGELLPSIPLVTGAASYFAKVTSTKKAEKIQVKLPGMMSSSLYVDAYYSDSDFETKSNVMNANLKVLSFAASCATDSVEDANGFYTTMGYDNVFYDGYEQITTDSIGYVIAHKSFGSYDVVSVAVRGFNYGKEWVSNFAVGSEGNHKGFDDKANEIYEKLDEYMTSFGNKTFKLWVTGYSRGGAVANVLASKLLKEREEIKVEKDNIFVYTYEAPRGLTKDNAVAYDNVFNFINDMDPVAKLLPEKYGLYRCGTDIVINKDKDIDAALKALDLTLKLPAFTPMESPYKFDSEVELDNVILNVLLEEYPGKEDVSIATREKYATNIEPTVRYLIEFFMDLPQNVLDEFMNTFKDLDSSLIMQWLFTDNGLYSVILKPILDKCEYEYDAEKLEPACSVADSFIKTKLQFISAFIDTTTKSINQQMVDNIMRVAGMHFPETVYALIK